MGRADQKKFKSFFGGKSLKDFRKSVGLDKNVSKGSSSKDNKSSSKNNKGSNSKKPSKDLLEEAQKIDQEALDQGSPTTTGTGRQTKDFIDDLKDAYKAGLFTGGTKTKDFMSKYGLTGDQIRDLRVGIDQGLGTRIGKGGNVLTDLVGDLRGEGILQSFGPSQQFLQQRASEIYEPGMKKSNMFLPFEDPQNIFEKGANLTTQYNPFLNIVSGIFGSSAGQRATYFGREKGLEGEELNQFAAAVANDRDLYNQMMATPEMQKYELNEFRAEANKNAMAKRRSGDPDPISGSQGGGDDEGDDGTTDPGTDPVYTPPPQNYFTFFDPNLGRYRSGTYDEYLQYVTAKDGGIIQLENGGTPPNAPGGVLPQGRKEQLEDLFKARREIQNLDTPTDSEAEGSRMIMEEIDDKAKALSDKSKEGIMMAMRDQPAKDLFAANNPDIGPALRDELGLIGKVKDSGLSLFMEALRKSDISTGSANQFLEEALNNFVAAGIIPPNTSYDQLTDPFKDLVTREAAMIAKSENMKAQEIGMQGPTIDPQTAPYIMQEGQREEFDRINPIFRGIPVQEQGASNMYEVADGGIIGLKEGGMNDMMQADSLMFNDPSDEGQWEYNV